LGGNQKFVGKAAQLVYIMLGVGNELSLVPLSSLYEMNPDHQLPAGPGSFHNESNAKWKSPHSFTSKFEQRLMPQLEKPIFSNAPAGTMLLLFPQTHALFAPAQSISGL
jgi:hypothetical protein